MEPKFTMLKKFSFCRHLGGRMATVGSLVLVLTACSTLRPLEAVYGPSAQGSWVMLNDASRLTLSPGLFLELPDTPYRARFADDQGIYFQASSPLRIRTQHGFVNEAEGGLYVRHNNPTQATAWWYPALGAPITPYTLPLKIHHFQAKP